MSTNLITQIFNFFIPESLLDEDAEKMAVPYVAVCVLSALLTFIIALLLPLSPLDANQLVTAETVAGLTILGFIGSLICLRSGGYLIVAVNLYSITVFANIVAIAFFTGGFSNSPQLILLIFIPIWSFLMLEHIYGVLASIAVALAVLILYTLEIQGFQFQQFIPVDALPFMRLQAWIGLLLIVVASLYSHINNYSALNARLKTERSRYAYESLHDPLTGLCNRTLFYKRARAAIEHTLDSELKMAIIYLDIDEFKPINDDFGHEAGDKVLKIVAERLTDVVRSSDTVARLGGDEFAIVLHGMKDKNVARIISEKVVDALCLPVNAGDCVFQLGVSLGVVVGPDDGTQLDTLIRLSDEAMYRAKRGSDTVCFV